MEVPAPREPALPGSLGEFRIRGLLGQGGSGIVYDATWGPRRVALKVLHPSLVGTERSRSQFLTEAARLQTIQHPAVVKVLATGELPDGRPYLAMERLDGETLAAVLARGPVPLDQTLALFEELCGAVGALHEQGLVHRDLKPENVFIVAGRHAVLLDFGIAKELAAPASTTTIDGGVRGTPAYMAPERFFGQPAGVATDLYELAVTLYAMLAGDLPWDDLADPEARLSPRPLPADAVPAELDVEIRRALSTRAQNRPPHAMAFLEAVRRAAGQPLTASPAPSETARMASGGHEIPAIPGEPSGPHAPWFAERKSTTDRGRTPLAWAPTEDARPRPEPPRRRRWPLVVAALVVAVALAGAAVAAYWESGEAGGGAVALAPPAGDGAAPSAERDPWAGPAGQPSGGGSGAGSSGGGAGGGALAEIPQTGEAVPAATARTELAAAIRHVPADTQVLVAAVVSELRGNEQIDQILGKLAGHARVVGLLDVLPCLQPIVSGSEWAVFAAKTLEDNHRGTVIVRGRWRRADIERCFANDMQVLELADGAKILQLPRLGWVDFLDDHTVYLSVREDLAAAQVHDLVRVGTGPTRIAQQLLAGMPAERTITAVVDGTDQTWQPELPKGTHLAAWLRVEKSGTTIDVAIDPHDAKAAQKLVDDVKPGVDELFAGTESRLLGRLDVRREDTAFRITGRLTSLMIGMIAAQVP